MKKICMVAYTYYLSDPRVRREAEALAERGDKVDFICLRKEGEKPFERINGVNLYRLPQVRYRGSDVFVYIMGYFLFFVRSFLRLNFLYFSQKYNLIHVDTMPEFLIFVTLIPKLFGTKVILDFHDLMPELFTMKFNFAQKDIIVGMLKFVEKTSAKFADYLITVTEPLKDILVKRNSRKCTVIMNLPDNKIFDRERVQINPKNDLFKLGYHGLITERYGLDTAIKAVSIGKDKMPNMKFYIYGDGDALSKFIKLTYDLNVNKFVYFSKCMLPLEKMPQIIANMDVGIEPRIKNRVTDTALSTKLLEYISMGVPVITSRTEFTAKCLDDSMVMFFEPGNEKDLAEKILYLYEHPEKRKKLVCNADRFNGNYNWVKEEHKYYKIIDELIEGEKIKIKV